MNLTTGTSLQNGKYIVNTTLGQGGFGITYRATHAYLGQPVVIKTLNYNWRYHTEFKKFGQEFIAEARRVTKCQHPNIVKVLDFFEENNLPFIVMEYIPGVTLDEMIYQHGPLSEGIAINYIHQIGSALTVVHENGLLHRDVKPHNIVRRSGSETVILIDFGIAREFTPGVTQTHTGLMSEGYAPIEQYLPQAKRTPATDVYALAATLYSLVTGKAPIAASLRDRIPLPKPRQLQPYLSHALEKAILQGLEMEAEKRPQSVEKWLEILPNIPPAFPSYSVTVTNATFPVIPKSNSGEEIETINQENQTSSAINTVVNSPQNNGVNTNSWRWMPLVFGITAIIAAIGGVGLGLAYRDRITRKSPNIPLQPSEQTFPNTTPWPGDQPVETTPESKPPETENTPIPRSQPETVNKENNIEPETAAPSKPPVTISPIPRSESEGIQPQTPEVESQPEIPADDWRDADIPPAQTTNKPAPETLPREEKPAVPLPENKNPNIPPSFSAPKEIPPALIPEPELPPIVPDDIIPPENSPKPEANPTLEPLPPFPKTETTPVPSKN